MGAGWPPLSYPQWKATQATLHPWTQVVGKIRLARTPWTNHSWHVAPYVTSRGLTTSPMPFGTRTFEILFDFLAHELRIQTSEGAVEVLRLAPRTVADFHEELFGRLRALGLDTAIRTLPCEIPDAVPFETDREHCTYDARAGHPVLAGPPVFYAYAYPEPAGFRTAPVRPAAARYEAGLGEFILPYHEVRKAESPDALLLEFLQSSYEAAATAGGWDRTAREVPQEP